MNTSQRALPRCRCAPQRSGGRGDNDSMFSDVLPSDLTAAASGSSVPKRKAPSETVEQLDPPFFSYVDQHADVYCSRLSEFVGIPSVSGEPARRPECVRAVKWVQTWCDKLGATTRLEDIGNETMADGSSLPLPPVLLAAFGDPAADPSKPTIVVYGHLDVQPAFKGDGWDTEPFELTAIGEQLRGRGASDDKGPVTAWLWMIEAFAALGRPLPCHLRCVFEAMEECGSKGLPDLVRSLARPGGFLDPELIEHVVISDNYYIGRAPCVTHGLRGNCYFHVDVHCSSKDMHSGVIGGSVHEAMTDVTKLLASLVDSDGTILIAGIHDEVPVHTRGASSRAPARA